MNDLVSELYSPVKTVPLKIKEANGIRETGPAEQNLFPFARFLKDLTPPFSVVSVLDESGKIGEPIRLEKVSDVHGRDFDVAVSREAFWFSKDGEYTNFYNNVSIKGARFDKPYVYKNARGELSIFGLLSLETPEKKEEMIKKGSILRAAGVETEKVELIVSPKEFIYDGQKITLEEFRTKLIEDVKARFISDDGKTGDFYPDELPFIEDYVNRFVPVLIVRSQQVPERLADFKKPKTKEQFTTMMKRIFRYVNNCEKIVANQTKEAPWLFDAEDENSVRDYFLNDLPQRIAINVARMHNAGIAHYNLNEENVSGVGSIYDLDTAWGKPIDGQEVTIENIKSDLMNLIAGFSKLCTENEQSPWLKAIFDNGGSNKFLQTFIDNYTMAARYKVPENFDIEVWLQAQAGKYFKSEYDITRETQGVEAIPRIVEDENTLLNAEVGRLAVEIFKRIFDPNLDLKSEFLRKKVIGGGWEYELRSIDSKYKGLGIKKVSVRPNPISALGKVHENTIAVDIVRKFKRENGELIEHNCTYVLSTPLFRKSSLPSAVVSLRNTPHAPHTILEVQEERESDHQVISIEYITTGDKPIRTRCLVGSGLTGRRNYKSQKELGDVSIGNIGNYSAGPYGSGVESGMPGLGDTTVYVSFGGGSDIRLEYHLSDLEEKSLRNYELSGGLISGGIFLGLSLYRHAVCSEIEELNTPIALHLKRTNFPEFIRSKGDRHLEHDKELANRMLAVQQAIEEASGLLGTDRSIMPSMIEIWKSMEESAVTDFPTKNTPTLPSQFKQISSGEG